MGGLHIEMCILAIHGERTDGSGLCKILSKSNIYITGTQNLLTVFMLTQLGIVRKWQYQPVSNLFETD